LLYKTLVRRLELFKPFEQFAETETPWGDGAVNETHAFGVRDPVLNPL